MDQLDRQVNDLGSLVLKPLASLIDAVITYAPMLLAAIAVLILGRVLAGIVRKGLTKVFAVTGFNEFAKGYEVDSMLQYVGIRRTLGEVIAGVAYWTIILLFVTTAFEILGMRVIVETLYDFIRFLPNIMLAAIVMVLAGLVSRLVKNAVKSALDTLDVTFGTALATLAQAVVLYFGAIVAAEKLNFDVSVVSQNASYLIIGAIAVAVISIGMGTRIPASQIISSYYTKQLYKPGDQVVLRGYEGTVKTVNNVAVILETRDGELIIPNDEALKGGSLPQAK